MYNSPVDPHLFEKALEYCLNFAKLMIQRQGHFLPFGAVINPSEQVESVAGDIGTRRPEPVELYKFLQDCFRRKYLNGEILASAIAVNVDIPPTYSPMFSDGIRVHLEGPGYSRFMYLPYSRSPVTLYQRLLGRRLLVDWGDLISVDVPGQVCNDSADS